MSETLIKVDGVSKKFCKSLKKSLFYGMQDLGREVTGRCHGGYGKLRRDEFWAVKDVSFELKRGECLGLIGHNGAGKTTLLKMLNGLIKPDGGRIEIHGQVGALIALGAGFNPILSGRENIYVNASVLGLTKNYVASKIDEIIEFAEIGEFIDTPVQNYSSGMNVRLGFAVAIILINPDILFLDEVLAVGDIGFTIKCLNAIRKIINKTAVVFVSHNMQFVSAFCNKVIVMDHGQVIMVAEEPAVGIDQYYSMVNNQQEKSGTGLADVYKIELIVNGVLCDGIEPVVNQGEEASAVIDFEIGKEVKTGAIISVNIDDESVSQILCVPVLDQQGNPIVFKQGKHSLEVPLGKLEFNMGKYSFMAAIREIEGGPILCRMQGIRPFRIYAHKSYWGKVIRPAFLSQDIISQDAKVELY
ncbi:MAG: ABC transporter ATP-binding protein [Chlorobium sp.]